MESIDLNKIKHLIFDFGGVLYEIDQNKTISEFRQLSKKKELFDNIGAEVLSEPAFADFETGKISPEKFRELIRKQYHLSCSDDEFDKAWNATLIGKYNTTGNPNNIMDLLLSLSKRFTLHLLSNTNQIHYNYFYDECKSMFGLFSNLFFSHEIGLRKPDIQTFQYVIAKLNIDPSTAIYFDDSSENCKSARKAGLNAVHVSNYFFMSDYLHSVNTSTHNDY